MKLTEFSSSSCIVRNNFLCFWESFSFSISISVSLIFTLGFTISYCRQVDHSGRHEVLKNLLLDIFSGLVWTRRNKRQSFSIRLAKYTHKQTKILGVNMVHLDVLAKGQGLPRGSLPLMTDKIPVTVINIPNEIHSLGRSPQNVNEKLISRFKKEMENFI